MESLAFWRRIERQDVLSALALGALIGVSYLPAMLWGGFVWDDRVFTDAEPVREVSGLWRIWFSPNAIENEGHYWPLVYSTFWLEHKLWGFAPTGYHVVNVLLHLANTLLLWRILRRLAVPGAWLVAAVFAVHPLHVESVAWVIERKDTLSALFYLAAVMMWLHYTDKPRPSRYALAMLLFIAGMLSKSIVVTLPVALLILRWWKQGRVTSTDLLRLTPFFVVGLAIALADVAYQSREGVSLGYSVIERVLIASHALWFYIGKLLWPSALAVIYPLWDIRIDDPVGWLYFIGAGITIAALWLLRYRIGRGPLAGALFFGITLSPTLGFVDYGFMQFSFVADRFQYLAGIGAMAVVVGAAVHWVSRRPDERRIWERSGLCVATAVLLVLVVLTWRQAGNYRNELTLFTHVIALNPQARYAHLNLGSELMRRKRPEEALAAYQTSIAKVPDDVQPHYGAGRALRELGRFDKAEEAFLHALEIEPGHENSLASLSDLWFIQRRYEEMLGLTQRITELDSGNAEAWAAMGVALYSMGRHNEAEDSFKRALEISPRHTASVSGLGGVLFVQRRYEEMLAVLKILAEIEPESPDVYSNIGIALQQMSRYKEALENFDRALSLDPSHQNTLNNRALLLEEMGLGK